ncbi:hypothetical protein H5410_014965 [Solanum commersonii]|uniref:Uncharacterized protein n=1 Tax=Solanum commersonii TaxID=4109 RepID=A0A9J5ZSA0_SOLCO|nr:hypothetical protein H5410_014965 [Solanum commersonii]
MALHYETVRCLVPFCSLLSMLCSSIQIPEIQVKKDVSNSVTQDSIMNAHNKTKHTDAKINCALKDSSCDTPFSKNLKLTILASNSSSSSTKVLKCPHTKNDSIFTHNGSQFEASESNTTLTLTKINTMYDFTHRFARIFQSTLASAHSK